MDGQTKNILLGIAVLAILYFAYRFYTCDGADADAGGKEGFCSPQERAEHHHRLMALRGAPHDAARQPHAYTHEDLAKHYRDWAREPRDIAQAAREAWFETTASGGTPGDYVPSMSGDPAASAASYHTHQPEINYQDALVDLVATPDIRSNHSKWVDEVAPTSRTALMPDDLDEAAVFNHGTSRVGLGAFRLPMAQVRPNSLFQLEVDAYDHATQGSDNFRFGG